MKRSFPIIICILFASLLNAQQPSTTVQSQQLMVVRTNGWASLQGTLYAYEKKHGQWVLQFSNAVVVGSNGLGIGDGLVPLTIAGAPDKKEGDLKAPAGIFTIGTAFGYADKGQAKWIKTQYTKAADTVICVDDMHSAHYNTLLNKDSTNSDWNSFEYMHRKDNYYKWGLFVNHNAGSPVPGKGSCIFMHIWENNHEGTEGCTAMQEADMLRLLHWINAKKNPLLVQMPSAEYGHLATQYGLPAIDK